MRAIIRNRTGIEDWILEKANFRRRNSEEKFVFPYDLGPWKNFFQVFNFSCHPIGDGVSWPVVKHCDQFTLTVGINSFIERTDVKFIFFRENSLHRKMRKD